MEVKAVPKSKLPREISPGPFALFYRRTAPCRRSRSISRKEIQLQQGGYDSPSGKGPGMLEIFTSLIQALNRVVWGIPALILILGWGYTIAFAHVSSRSKAWLFPPLHLEQASAKAGSGRRFSLSGSMHGVGCHRRNRKHRRMCDRTRIRRPGSHLLDVACCVLRHGNDLRRGVSRADLQTPR